MCGDPLRELVVAACEITAPIIHSQWRGENHDLPAHWMHFVVQPGKIFQAVGDNPVRPRMQEIVRYILKREGYVVLNAPGIPGRYGPMCRGCSARTGAMGVLISSSGDHARKQPGAGLGTASRLRVGTGRTADVNPRGFDSPVRHGFANTCELEERQREEERSLENTQADHRRHH